ncbi:MAG: SdrD B-like domain-containing protein, partial [Bacteroidota bacterium]
MKKTEHIMQQKIILFCLFAWISLTAALDAEYFSSRVFSQLKTHVQQHITISSSAETTTRSLSSAMPCGGNAGEIGGRVFGDYNKNGLDDQVGAIADVTVTYYECLADGTSALAGTATTDADGAFTLTNLTDGIRYRLEFTPPSNEGLTPGFVGDNGTDVQFITAPACDVRAAFSHPDDYCDDAGNPIMFAACFVNGDPYAPNSLTADEETIVYFNYNSEGTSPTPTTVATAQQTGAVYGMAYAKSQNTIFTSAFAKRHTGLSLDNLGAIFAVDVSDLNNATTTPLVNVNSIGIDVGTLPSNADRGLSDDPERPSNDPDAYDAVGKLGIGSIALSESDNVLWLTNLNDGNVYSIDLTSYYANGTSPTVTDVSSFTISANTACPNGTLRPFAIEIHRGNVYVGAVCDAEMGTAADLRAKVFRLNTTSGVFEEIVDFSLDYVKGYAFGSNDCRDEISWYPWRDDLPAGCLPTSTPDNEPIITIVHPTPILSDIKFDVNGDMILGFMDRFGHQVGYENYPLTGTSPLINTVTGGEILRAAYDRATESYTLENNGSAGNMTTAGMGNMQGPGGGEYYYFDVYEGPINNLNGEDQPHRETAQGALAFYAGSGDVATTALDPYSTDFNSGGVNWFSNTTGTVRRNSGYRIFATAGANNATFQKASGLGEILISCVSAPIEIGSYVWDDANGNGVQDACETGIGALDVALLDAMGNTLATNTTDNDGYVYFDSRGTTNLLPNAIYYLTYATGDQFDTSTGTISGDRSVTLADMGMGTQAELNDSDATIATAAIANGAITGRPYVEIAVGNPGFVSHQSDIGFRPQTGVGGEIWQDANGDGLLGNDEFPIEGITIRLYDA